MNDRQRKGKKTNERSLHTCTYVDGCHINDIRIKVQILLSNARIIHNNKPHKFRTHKLIRTHTIGWYNNSENETESERYQNRLIYFAKSYSFSFSILNLCKLMLVHLYESIVRCGCAIDVGVDFDVDVDISYRAVPHTYKLTKNNFYLKL